MQDRILVLISCYEIGNRNAAAMTADLESMKRAGIGNALFPEVNVGVPPGPVKIGLLKTL